MPELEERLARGYAATTEDELASVTVDLPDFRPVGGTVPAQRDVGVLSSFRRGGRFVVGSRVRATAVVGGGIIDLRHATFAAREVTVRVDAVVGTVVVIVPEHAEVRVHGTGVLGGFDTRDEGPGTPGAVTVTVTGLAVIGTVEVLRLGPDEPVDRARIRAGGKRRRPRRPELPGPRG
jgi:hypothetical protein